MSENNGDAVAKTFRSTSSDHPQLLNISFADDPKGNLGAQLLNCDKKGDAEMFLPAYAVVARLIGEDTVALKAGVRVGDVLVAVNGQGFRRFAPDYKPEEVEQLNDSVTVTLDHRVVEPGSAYNPMLASIKKIKAAAAEGNGPPLVLSFERYGWDARPNAWNRFLAARDNNVPNAMQLIQEHELWRLATFPISLEQPGLQHILRQKAVSEIDIERPPGLSESFDSGFPPCVYVQYAKLLAMQSAGDITSDDVVAAFVIFNERMLSKAAQRDARFPKTCQFIDVTGMTMTQGLSTETLKKIYKVFEPNYPETLHKMVMYPVSTMLVRTYLRYCRCRSDQTIWLVYDVVF